MFTLSILHLAADAIMVLFSSLLLIRLPCFSEEAALVHKAILVMLLSAAQIVLLGLLLGYSGFLSAWGFSLAHTATLILLLSLMRRRGESARFLDFSSLRKLLKRLIRETELEERIIISLITFLLLFAGVYAVIAPAVDFDSLGYRLSRIGLWLQEGSIWQRATTDPRMNYSAIGGDLLQLWMTSHFSNGYPLVGLVQWIGGILLIFSTYRLGRILTISRIDSLLAVVLILGMPVVISQMTTEQVDLLVAAFFTTSIVILMDGFQKRHSTWAGWIAFALAISVKGTVFYLAPGLILMALVWVIVLKLDLSYLLKQVLPALVCCALFAAPRYAENYWNFGNPFADRDSLARLQGEGVEHDVFEQLQMNLVSHGLQVLSPASNRPIPSISLQSVAEPFIMALPGERDPYTLSTARRPFFAGIFVGTVEEIPPLMGSNGLLSSILALIGIGFCSWHALTHRRCRSSWLLLSLILLMISFTLFFYTRFQWSPYTFRFFILILPILSLLGVFWIRSLPSILARSFRMVVCGFSLCTALVTLSASPGVGLQAINNPESTLAFATHKRQLAALEDFVPENATIAVSLPYYAPLSAFFRNEQNYSILLVPERERVGYETPQALMSSLGCGVLISSPGNWKNVPDPQPVYWWVPSSDRQSSHAFAIWIGTGTF